MACNVVYRGGHSCINAHVGSIVSECTAPFTAADIAIMKAECLRDLEGLFTSIKQYPKEPAWVAIIFWQELGAPAERMPPLNMVA